MLKRLGKILLIIFVIANLIAINLWAAKTDIRIKMIDTSVNIYQKIFDKMVDNIMKELREHKELLKTLDDVILNKINENEAKEIQLEESIIKKMISGNVDVYGLLGNGSGTVIKKNKHNMYILTCYHVIEDIIEIRKINPFKYPVISYGDVQYPVDIVKVDKENDLALLKSYWNDIRLGEIKISDTKPKKGDKVYVVGSPLGLSRNISKGILSNDYQYFYIVDAVITFGNSGGALYNDMGELIGVPVKVFNYMSPESEIVSPESSLGMSINLDTIKAFLKGVNLDE